MIFPRESLVRCSVDCSNDVAILSRALAAAHLFHSNSMVTAQQSLNHVTHSSGHSSRCGMPYGDELGRRDCRLAERENWS